MKIEKHQHHKKNGFQHGSMLIEMTVALGLLTAIGLFLLKGSLDVMAPRQWIIKQNITDAYLSYEEAYAKRVSYDEFTESGSDWPIYPLTTDPPEEVEVGRLPGGKAITGTLIRTRVADDSNLPALGDTSYDEKLAANPAKMETWKLQSHLTYTIGNRTYVKSRTVVRTR